MFADIQVVHTQGRAQLWDSFQSLFRSKGRTAVRASQQLGQPGNTLLSRAELGGPGLYITASGTYTVLVSTWHMSSNRSRPSALCIHTSYAEELERISFRVML